MSKHTTITGRLGDGTPARLVEAALLAAWDDGNALGLDGWIGPERGEDPDEHAIRRREEYVRKALDRLAGEVR